MTKEEIDKLLDEMAAEAAAKGDDDLRPGLIYLSDRLYGTEIRTETVSAVRGQRYRGIRVFVSRGYDTKVITRKETAGLEVGAFEDLTPLA
ncbi:hypothetical protein [Caulobacter endophyticus]|uniref:hypothetical protein n=1 Tax=Caulobacter endophyticus TaxID=2172652 RepID=UPI00240F2E1B|nr:hypothetical protein [Caulobacter endophyticus]MDG2527336.1 hypothetical protein [Caulobacter endophyticus]